MDIEQVLKELDSLPGGEDTAKTGKFLEDKIRLAHEEGDHGAELTLINEMIGYLRYTGRYDEAPKYGDAAIRLCNEQGLCGQIPYATTLLNIATADRAAGRLEESLKRYKEVEEIYGKLLSDNDYLYAALYNNMSLLYQARDEFSESALCLEKALKIIDGIDSERIAQAITRTNLAQAYMKLAKYDEAKEQLSEAEDIFEELGGDEFHYPGCLNAIAQLHYMEGNKKESVRYYKKALELLKKHVGEDNPSYLAVLNNLREVTETTKTNGDGSFAPVSDDKENKENKTDNGNKEDTAGKEDRTDKERSIEEESGIEEDNKKEHKYIKGMELSRRFYEEYGRPMIHERFPEYEERITTGLVGRGSQCYGFDDELSTDHDFGPDFCMWVDDDVYDEIGDELEKAYDELPGEYLGYKRVMITPPDGRRVGVIRTKGFYCRILEISEDILDAFLEASDEINADLEPSDEKKKSPLSPQIYNFYALIKEENLSGCTNGEIFSEGTGDFIKIRNKLSYYPDTIWRRKIAEELHYSAQMGQYNYIRMLKRGEKVASEIALSGYMEHTMKLVYLINRKYAPYYKWLHRGMAGLEKAAVIMDIFNAVYDMPKGDERIRMTTEIVAAIIIEELERIGMAGNVPPDEKFLDVYSQVIINNVNN